MKKIIALILSLTLLSSLTGCRHNAPAESEKEDKPKNETVSQKKPEIQDAPAENNSLVGTWVVTKTEVYDGPLKAMAEQLTNTYFYVGSEHEFTADGIYKSADGKMTTNYSILDENHITMTEIGTGNAVIYDYELNGDEYIQYGNYTGTAADLGHANAVYFRRK